MGERAVLEPAVSVYQGLHPLADSAGVAAVPPSRRMGWRRIPVRFPHAARGAKPGAFTNDGETLFDAIDHVAIDFRGSTAACGAGGCDLSGFVAGDAGVFESRDDLFAAVPLFQHTMRGRAFELLYGGRKSS